MATKTPKQVISRQGGERIGSYLWWTLRDVEVTRGRLARMLDQQRLDQRLMPPPIVGHAAYRKAIASCKAGDRGMLLRLITETPQEIVYGVVRENVDAAAEDLRYHVKAKVIFRKRTETVVIRGGQSAVATEVKKRYEE